MTFTPLIFNQVSFKNIDFTVLPAYKYLLM